MQVEIAAGESYAGLGADGDLVIEQRRHKVPGAAAIAVGPQHGCAVREDGTFGCAPKHHELGFSKPGLVAASFGARVHCGLNLEGGIRCWDRRGGSRVTPDERFIQLESTRDATCAIREDGALRCWKETVPSSRNPSGLIEREAPDGSFTRLSCGHSNCCALTGQGGIECWGADGWGQSDPVQGSFSGERRKVREEEIVEGIRREEHRGGWRWEVSEPEPGPYRKGYFQELFEEHPDLEVSMSVRGTIGIDGEVGTLAWDPVPPEAPSLKFGLTRDWRFGRGHEPIPFSCTWNLEAGSPTYDFGCEIEFVTGTYEFVDTMTWETPGWP